MFESAYKEKASRAYLEYVKSCSNLLTMVEAEIRLAKATGNDYGIAVLNNRRQRYSDDRRRRYTEEIERADSLIGLLDDTLADVLRRQYIECQSQERIADEIGYVVRTVQRFSRDGRAELYEHLPLEFR